MPFDPSTMRYLEHQARRMHYVLHETFPPDRKEAELIQRRVDGILDRRPREPIAVTSHGELIWPDSSSWVADQALYDAGGVLPPAQTIAVNATPDPEYVVRPDDMPTGLGMDDLSVPGGGVAVLDRPERCATCMRLGHYCGHDR